MRAAASSMAKGSPSRRAQISATAGAFSLVTEKSDLASWALSTKSLTASYWVRRSGRAAARDLARRGEVPGTPSPRRAREGYGLLPRP